MKDETVAGRIASLEAHHENSVGWMKDISDRVKHVERTLWYGVGLLTALQLLLKFYKP